MLRVEVYARASRKSYHVDDFEMRVIVAKVLAAVEQRGRVMYPAFSVQWLVSPRGDILDPPADLN
jgi:hypothetical protein